MNLGLLISNKAMLRGIDFSYKLVFGSNINELFEIVQENPIEVLILEEELLEPNDIFKLKELSPSKILLITKEVNRFLETPIDDFIVKPFSLDQLIHRLSMLNRKIIKASPLVIVELKDVLRDFILSKLSALWAISDIENAEYPSSLKNIEWAIRFQSLMERSSPEIPELMHFIQLSKQALELATGNKVNIKFNPNFSLLKLNEYITQFTLLLAAVIRSLDEDSELELDIIEDRAEILFNKSKLNSIGNLILQKILERVQKNVEINDYKNSCQIIFKFKEV